MRILTRFHHPRKGISVIIPQRSQRLWDHEMIFLRCYIAAKITPSFVNVEKDFGFLKKLINKA